MNFLMSGGSLNYFYSNLEDHAGDFDDKELDDLVRDLSELFRAREWFLSSDTNEGTWNEARDKFKQKWFSQSGRDERIIKYMDTIRDEVFKSFGISDRYCKNCLNWTAEEKEGYEEYGECTLIKGCLMHRSESCGNFGKKRKEADPDA